MVIASGLEERTPRPKGIAKDQVASLIAPGGIFAEESAESVPLRRDRPKDTTYSEAFPGIIPAPEHGGFTALQAPILQGRRSIRQHEATAFRTVVREPLDTWKENLKKDDQVDPTAAARAYRRQHRTREEHERRWRRWMKQRQRETNPEGACLSSLSGTLVSSIPAGLRPAKCIGDSFPDGIRLPLFGQDTPIPIWSTLADAPWLDGKRFPSPRVQDETPWLKVDDPTHPLQEAERRKSRRSRTGLLAHRSGAASVASATGEVRENCDPQPHDP